MNVPLNRRDVDDNIYAQLIESIDGIVWEADAETMIMSYVSPAAERLLGYALREWLEPNFWIDHVHPEDRTWVKDFCSSQTLAGKSHDFEYRMVRIDGTEIWLRDIVTLVTVDGKCKLRGLMVDVTEKKRNDQERQERVRLLESMDRIAKAIEGASDSEQLIQNVLTIVLDVFDCDRAWLVSACDPATNSWRVIRECVRPGCTDAFRSGKTFSVGDEVTQFLQHILPVDHPQAFCNLSDPPMPKVCCDSYQVKNQVCMSLHPRSGNVCIFGIHYCGSSARKLHDTEMELFKQIGLRIADALTALHITKELRDSELRFRTFFNHVVDSILIHDIDGRVIDANEQACQSLGYSKDELLRVSPEYLDIGFSDFDHRHFREMLDRNELIHFVAQHRKKNGDLFPVEVWVKRFMLGEQKLTISLARDMSDKKRLEEQFHQSQKMEAIGRLAGGMAHDFNNLLTVIGGYSEMILSNDSLPSIARGYVEEIKKANLRASTLTQQLLAFSRRKLLKPRVVDVNQTLIDLKTLLLRLIREDIEVSIAPKAQIAGAKMDAGQFEHAMINLVVNAQDAMPGGGRILIDTRNIPSNDSKLLANDQSSDTKEYLEISITDNGTGIEEHIRDRIFEPFFTTKDPGKGTGLGLAMVYGFVQQSHGTIKVDSIIGQGTTIRMVLPAVNPSPSEVPVTPIYIDSSQGMETILLVEDEPHVRELAELTLRQQGYKVLVASDGEEGLRIARDTPAPIDLLVSDLVMPHMSGGKLAEHLRSDRPSLRVLFISGYIDQETPRMPAWIDFSYCQKPFTPQSLLDKVRESLRKRPSPPQTPRPTDNIQQMPTP